ncbi:MAG: hypothetical protein J7L96_00860, partial [Bacteroidales bacterium]|nr:hypothetical protein [Bacteroidales bacterium]
MTGKSMDMARIRSFFPLQLLVGYLKNNQLILLSWLIPFLIIFRVFGVRFGFPSLFLTPEYLGAVSYWSFLFMGLATGTFIMAFHIASYVVMAHRYPFIVTLSKPFLVYSVNNSVIPFTYLVLYIIQSIHYQRFDELISTGHI